MAAFAGFNPCGKTIVVALSTSPTAAFQPSTGQLTDYRIVLLSTGPNAYVSYGATTAAATTGSSGGSTACQIPLGYGNPEVLISGIPNAWFSGMTTGSALTAALAVTPGVILR